MAIPATTDAGLRIKALAVALANILSFNRPPSELDYTEAVARKTLESVIAVLGIKVDPDLITLDPVEPAAA